LSNENVTASKNAAIVMDRTYYYPYSSGKSSSGGGGSPEPATNVEVKELSQTFVASGSAAKFDFPKNVTSVVYVSFDSKKTAGKITTIVEMLKNKSTLTSDTPTGEVYKYLNIWAGSSGFGTSNIIKDAVVCFKVEKLWIQDKNIDQSFIILSRYSDKKWNPLSTNLSGEDDKYLYFTAETPGFSPFAITGKIAAKGFGNEMQPVAVNEIQNKPINGSLGNNNGNATANIEQTPEQIQSSNTSGKGSTKMSDFEIASGIISLLSVFLYKRK
jgi:PGF-pre-PGF domain-containing protein